MLGIGTGSLARLSPNGPALIAAHEARIRATPAESLRPGVAEQYKIQLDKLKVNITRLEIINMPTLISRPSTSLSPTDRRLVVLMGRLEDLPELGKKYLTCVDFEPSVVMWDYCAHLASSVLLAYDAR